MRIESKLCHITENKAIVKVNGWINDQNIGSALAEGPTVELAEDKAISRLRERIHIIDSGKSKNTNPDDKIKPKLQVELSKREKDETIKVDQEPSDWSNELSAIDSEIMRLKWTRDDEIKFLEENLGYNNRSKITNYKDIVNYLELLKKINNLNSSKVNTISINSLIVESDNILRELSWNNTKGREYLLKEFNVSTRKELNQEQLISFVSKLKSIRNQYLTQ